MVRGDSLILTLHVPLLAFKGQALYDIDSLQSRKIRENIKKLGSWHGENRPIIRVFPLDL